MGEENIEPAGPEELEETRPEEQPSSERPVWLTAIMIVAAILLLCCVVAVCTATAIYLFFDIDQATPAPTPVEPVQVFYISISEPVQGAILDITRPIAVTGSGAGLFEGNVVVQVIDRDGNILAQEPTVLQGPNVGMGGEGTWKVQLTVETQPGMAGQIRAFSPSPVDGSIVAEDRVEVSLGSTPAVKTYIQIDDPVAGQTLDIANPVTIRGKGAGLPEGNVVVQALDRDGNELALLPTILQGPDVGTGGEGTWEVQLTIETEPGMAGQIRAFSPSPDSDELVADSAVQVTYGEEVLDLEGQTWILERTLLKTEITAIFQDGKLTGSAGCNTYNGTYTITSGSGESQITIGPLATTRMACSQKVMDQESRYLSALEAAEAYMIEGTTLTIYFPGGALIYEAEKE